MDAFIDHYEVLEVSPQARRAVIKGAYRNLMLEEHPDKGGTTARTQQINRAYEVLSDPVERARFDREREATIRARAAEVSHRKHAASSTSGSQAEAKRRDEERQQEERLRIQREAEAKRREEERQEEERLRIEREAEAKRQEEERCMLLGRARLQLEEPTRTLRRRARWIPGLLIAILICALVGFDAATFALIAGRLLLREVVFLWLATLLCLALALTLAVARAWRASQQFASVCAKFEEAMPGACAALKHTEYEWPKRYVRSWPLRQWLLVLMGAGLCAVIFAGVALSGVGGVALTDSVAEAIMAVLWW